MLACQASSIAFLHSQTKPKTDNKQQTTNDKQKVFGIRSDYFNTLSTEQQHHEMMSLETHRVGM
jgi:hypothetical protein